ncbi:biosynthesis O-methyltransferase [Seminavis robusta]|uniref:Biosynthesis O-methyltransferase n=1 Tax=Seminavis robusta TaxID=568900 RepID=A0A9N8HRS2_9STRA|nr:biosynthesis O-methyltransferase [Seminavis robusta]|eukprot:Sro1432_g272160.1 biosynthesis O-methyltransferase (362) ;mRNA; f:24863-25948
MAPFTGLLARFMVASLSASASNNDATIGSGGDQYIHAKENVERQGLLHQCFRQSSSDAFSMSGILEASQHHHNNDKETFRVLEIGCGAGHTTLDLLLDVLPDHCHITAVDADPKLIASAQTRLSSQGFSELQQKRVTFQHQTGESLAESMAGQFDSVWVRFVVVHLPDPLAFLEAAAECLKPGGTILVEDIYVPGATSLCHPPLYAHTFFHEMHTKASRKLGGDLTRGAKIGDYLQSLGSLQNIQCNTFAPIFGRGVTVRPWTSHSQSANSSRSQENTDTSTNRFNLGWSLLEQSLASLMPKLRELEVCTEEEVSRAEESLASWKREQKAKGDDDERTCSYQMFALPDGTVFQWWATRMET